MTDIEKTNEEIQQEPLAENASAVEETPVASPEETAVAEPEATEVEQPEAEAAAEQAAPAEPIAEEAPVAEEAPAAEETEAAEPVAAEEEPVAQDEEMPEPMADEQDEESKKYSNYQTKEEIIARLKEIVEGEDEISRQEVEALKSNFYRIQKQQSEDAYKAYIDGGGDPDAYMPAPNTDEAAFKDYMAAIREKRAAQHEAEVQTLEDNYAKKLTIIEKIKEILATPDEVNKSYNDFKALQQQWNEIKSVPAEKATDLWKTYQLHVEQFYDTLKLNNEFRAYDFKKNLELKTALCERAEKLQEEEDVVSASRKLQQLHQEFREIGPVERDLREGIWNRFKAASTIINKRHQEYFESRKAQELENLEKKSAICDQVEGFELDSLKTFADWNAISDKIIALQAEWKTIGFAPQKMNVKIFERFRAACDNFFTRKAEFFKSVRDSLNNNLKLKEELVAQAEALKDSTAWKETTDAIIALQKKWKEIGTVPKKFSDDVWNRFNAACDAFFEAKKAANSSQRSEQNENLQKKQAIIDELAAIDPATEVGDYRPKLRKAQEDWNNIGHVPYKVKEDIYKAFRAQMDRLYGALSERASRNRVSRFRDEVRSGDGNKIRERLLRQYDILKNEIKTYENNLGFLSLSSKSKSGNALVEELNRKVDKLRADLEEIRQKIAALDEKKD
ncbi:MAG: DUF349 domain-containing protein [Bacteroidaceae bacterium]|nr:DUF349 domain-containing protein [Bacteroidaceae bacterium]